MGYSEDYLKSIGKKPKKKTSQTSYSQDLAKKKNIDAQNFNQSENATVDIMNKLIPLVNGIAQGFSVVDQAAKQFNAQQAQQNQFHDRRNDYNINPKTGQMEYRPIGAPATDSKDAFKPLPMNLDEAAYQQQKAIDMNSTPEQRTKMRAYEKEVAAKDQAQRDEFWKSDGVTKAIQIGQAIPKGIAAFTWGVGYLGNHLSRTLGWRGEERKNVDQWFENPKNQVSLLSKGIDISQLEEIKKQYQDLADQRDDQIGVLMMTDAGEYQKLRNLKYDLNPMATMNSDLPELAYLDPAHSTMPEYMKLSHWAGGTTTDLAIYAAGGEVFGAATKGVIGTLAKGGFKAQAISKFLAKPGISQLANNLMTGASAAAVKGTIKGEFNHPDELARNILKEAVFFGTYGAVSSATGSVIERLLKNASFSNVMSKTLSDFPAGAVGGLTGTFTSAGVDAATGQRLPTAEEYLQSAVAMGLFHFAFGVVNTLKISRDQKDAFGKRLVSLVNEDTALQYAINKNTFKPKFEETPIDLKQAEAGQAADGLGRSTEKMSPEGIVELYGRRIDNINEYIDMLKNSRIIGSKKEMADLIDALELRKQKIIYDAILWQQSAAEDAARAMDRSMPKLDVGEASIVGAPEKVATPVEEIPTMKNKFKVEQRMVGDTFAPTKEDMARLETLKAESASEKPAFTEKLSKSKTSAARKEKLPFTEKLSKKANTEQTEASPLSLRQKRFLTEIKKYNYNLDEALAEITNNKTKYENYTELLAAIDSHFGTVNGNKAESKTTELFHGNENPALTDVSQTKTRSGDIPGHYFTDDKAFAETFAHEKIPSKRSMFLESKGKPGMIYKANVDSSKMLDLTKLNIRSAQKLLKDIPELKSDFTVAKLVEYSKHDAAGNQMIKISLHQIKDIDKKLQELGYTGIKAKLGKDKGNEYIVFDTKNVTDFKPEGDVKNEDNQQGKKTIAAGAERSKSERDGEIGFKNSKAKRILEGLNPEASIIEEKDLTPENVKIIDDDQYYGSNTVFVKGISEYGSEKDGIVFINVDKSVEDNILTAAHERSHWKDRHHSRNNKEAIDFVNSNVTDKQIADYIESLNYKIDGYDSATKEISAKVRSKIVKEIKADLEGMVSTMPLYYDIARYFSANPKIIDALKANNVIGKTGISFETGTAFDDDPRLFTEFAGLAAKATATHIDMVARMETPEFHDPEKGMINHSVNSRMYLRRCDPDVVKLLGEPAPETHIVFGEAMNEMMYGEIMSRQWLTPGSEGYNMAMDKWGNAKYSVHNKNLFLENDPKMRRFLKKLTQSLAERGVVSNFVNKKGYLIPDPIEMVAHPQYEGKFKFWSFLRSIPQMFIDSLDPVVFETVRKDMSDLRLAIYKAYKAGDTSVFSQKDFDTYLNKTLGQLEAEGKGWALVPAVRKADKTLAAANMNTLCPSFTVGVSSCWMDGCYLTKLGEANGVNLFEIAMYTRDWLGVDDETIKHVEDTGGLRINGMGDTIDRVVNQWKDMIEDSNMRGNSIKIITKRIATFKNLKKIKDSNVDISKVFVQASTDTMWQPAAADKAYALGLKGKSSRSKVMGIPQVVKRANQKRNFKTGEYDESVIAAYELMGSETKKINGQWYRKSGLTIDQIDAFHKEFPEINLQIRNVVSTAKDLCETALRIKVNKDGIPLENITLNHSAPNPQVISEFGDELLNFPGRHLVIKDKTGWHFENYTNAADNWKRVNSRTHAIVEKYAKEHYTLEEQDKIFSTIQKSLCCTKSKFKDACEGCNGNVQICSGNITTYEPHEPSVNKSDRDRIRKQIPLSEDINFEKPETTKEMTLAEKARAIFGTTKDFKEAGYLTTDGYLIDFSGKIRDEEISGERFMDHYEIFMAFDEIPEYPMYSFMNEGHIRMMPEGDGMEISKIPTFEQELVISEYAKHLDGRVWIDLKKGAFDFDTDAYREYNTGTKPDRILNDIKEFYRTGKLPMARLGYGINLSSRKRISKKTPVPFAGYVQQITSKDTSQNQIPKPFGTKFGFFDRARDEGKHLVNLGAGGYTTGADFLLSEYGIIDHSADPFHLEKEQNEATYAFAAKGIADYAAVNSVLNVINQAKAREQLIVDAAASIKPEGTAFFTIHEGSKEDQSKPPEDFEDDGKPKVGKVSKWKTDSVTGERIPVSWQNYIKKQWYLPEIKKYFNKVRVKSNVIIATEPFKHLFSNAFELPADTNQPLFTHTGYKIERNKKTGVGKPMGIEVYLHKNYALDVIPEDIYKKALAAFKAAPNYFDFNCLRYTAADQAVRFDLVPDFDTASEPTPTRQQTVRPDGTLPKETPNKQIWHHKWQWVRDDYKGFDAQKSYEWSKEWLSKFKETANGYPDKWAEQKNKYDVDESFMYSDRKRNKVEKEKTWMEINPGAEENVQNVKETLPLTSEQKSKLKDSKVLDDEGNLQLVYHGSRFNFEEFNFDKIGSHFHDGLGKVGAMFTNSKYLGMHFSGMDGMLIKAFLNFEKPFVIDLLNKTDEQKNGISMWGFERYLDLIKRGEIEESTGKRHNLEPSPNYDGIIIKNIANNYYSDKYILGNFYIAFNADQIIRVRNTRDTKIEIAKRRIELEKKSINMLKNYIYKAKSKNFANYNEEDIPEYNERISAVKSRISEIQKEYPELLAKPNTDPGINLSDRERNKNVPAFFMKSAKVIESKIVSDKVSQAWLMKTLRRNGVTEEELDWLDLEDYFLGRDQIDKAGVLEYIRMNDVALEDVVLDSNKLRGESEIQDFVDAIRVETDNKSYLKVYEPDDSIYVHIEDIGNITGDEHFYIDNMNPGFNYGESTYDPELEMTTWHEVEYYVEQRKFDMAELYSDDNGFSPNVETSYHEESYLVPGEHENYKELNIVLPENKGRAPYYSSHWNKANILAHVRFDDRMSQDGKKVLFIEEIQSDWHQQGKKAGYDITGENNKQNQQERDMLQTEYARLQAEQEQTKNPFKFKSLGKRIDEIGYRLDELTAEKLVPNAPFKDTSSWIKLAMKKMIFKATSEGYDYIAWANGTQNAQHYSLEKKVSKITYDKSPVKSGIIGNALWSEDKGKIYVSAHAIDGKAIWRGNKTPKEIEDTLGKDILQKINDGGNSGTLQGIDLKMGGEGMREFYDNIVPFTVQKYVKQWNSKVEYINIHDHGNFIKQMAIPITEEMKESALNIGQSYFSDRKRTKMISMEERIKQEQEVIIERLMSDPKFKELSDELAETSAQSDPFVYAVASKIKNHMGITLNIKDLHRNFRDSFGMAFPKINRDYLVPFYKAKLEYTRKIKEESADLYDKVIKKFGIKKDSKLSAAIQWYGEKEKPVPMSLFAKKGFAAQTTPYELENLKKDFPDDWKNIVEAEKYFRNFYDRILNEINEAKAEVYPNVEKSIANAERVIERCIKILETETDPVKIRKTKSVLAKKQATLDSGALWKNKRIPKRTDYFRHFQEMNQSFEAIRNFFENSNQIDTSLVTVSEFTSPKSKWSSIAQSRGRGRYKADAVGGFLDYIYQAAYAIHIDPMITKFRQLEKDVIVGTANTKNANDFIMYLHDFANALSGKTNDALWDRALNKAFTRDAMAKVYGLNSRMKTNQVLGNLTSSMAQIMNLPNGLATIKNPVSITKGLVDTAAGFFGSENIYDLYEESQFISERYMQNFMRKFDSGILEQPKKLAAWILGIGDEVGTKIIWNSALRQALSKGIEDPIQYADTLTRLTVAGRGIGEVPLLQQSKSFQLIAPFQIEVTNFWMVMKDRIKFKDFGGLVLLVVLNWLFNNVMESIRGSRVSFDPIHAVQDAVTTINDEKESNPLKMAQIVGGRMIGEVFSSLPLGQSIAATFFPDYPTDITNPADGSLLFTIPSREQFFGSGDPTRFGTGAPMVTKIFTDPLNTLLYGIIPSFGGAQLKKTVEGAQAVSKGMVETKKGNIKYMLDDNDTLQTLLFGKASNASAKEYFDKKRKPLTDKESAQIKGLSDREQQQAYYDMIVKLKEFKKSEKDAIAIATDEIRQRLENKEMVTLKEIMDKYAVTVTKAQDIYRNARDTLKQMGYSDTLKTFLSMSKEAQMSFFPTFKPEEQKMILDEMAANKLYSGYLK